MSEMQRWEDWNASGGPRYPHEKVVQFFFRSFPVETRRSLLALDLGCGSGVHTVFLARDGVRVLAVDVSETGVANTQQRLRESGLEADVRVGTIDTVEASNVGLVVCAGSSSAQESRRPGA